MKDINIFDNKKNINIKLNSNEINTNKLLVDIYEEKYVIKDIKTKDYISSLNYNLFILYKK